MLGKMENPELSVKSLANCGSGTVPYDVTTVP